VTIQISRPAENYKALSEAKSESCCSDLESVLLDISAGGIKFNTPDGRISASALKRLDGVSKRVHSRHCQKHNKTESAFEDEKVIGMSEPRELVKWIYYGREINVVEENTKIST
jgi:hypothetical protein